MDLIHILSCLQHTLSTSAEVRSQAENQLKQFEGVNGYSVALLQIVSNDQVDIVSRQAAAIALKTFVRKAWDPHSVNSGEPMLVINDEDKSLLKTNIVESIIHVPPKVRTQIAVMLGWMVENDFPAKWPDLIPRLMAYITSQNLKFTYGALEALRRTFKRYEYLGTNKKQDRVILSNLVESVFPVLIQLFQALVTVDTLESADMQATLVRIFWSGLHMGLLPYFYDQKNIMPWMNLQLLLLQKEVPLHGQPSDPDERPQYPWWRAKRWAADILLKSFQRYGDPKLAGEKAIDQQFAKRYTQNYGTKLLEIFTGLLESRRKGNYVPDRIVYSALTFMDVAIRRNSLYTTLKPHINVLFQEIVFPILCINDEDLRLWEEDPQEYIRRESDLIDELHSLRSAATNLVIDIGTWRAKNHLATIVQFVAGLLQSNPSPRIKDGVFTVIGALSAKLAHTSPYKDQLETILTTYCIPEYSSPYGFMRKRSMWLFQQFFDINFKNPETFLISLRAILHLLSDKELPVKITAAVSLKFVMANELSIPEVRPILPNLMQILFNMMNEVENDELVTSFGLLIDTFGEEITPYAVGVCQGLVQTFLRLFVSDAEDSVTAAWECLSALQTLLDAIHKRPELYIQVEPFLFPMLVQLFTTNEGTEFHEEALRIVSFITFFAPTISPNMWTLFPKICVLLEHDGMDFITDVIGPLDNYISRSTETFLTGDHLQMVFNIVKRALEDDNMPESQARDTVQFIEIILISCRGRVDHVLEPFIEMAVNRLHRAKKMSYKVILIEVIAVALFYNPILTLSILEKRGWTQSIFVLWFQHLTKFVRTHDKKIVILGLSSVLRIPMNQWPSVITGGMKQMLSETIKLCFTRDKQVKDLEEEEKKLAEEDAAELEEEYPDDEDQDLDEEIEDTSDNLDDLARQAAAARGGALDSDDEVDDDEDDDEDLDDLYEDGVSNAVDDIDEVVSFTDILRDMAVNNIEGYTMMIAHLDAQSQHEYQQLIHLADKRRLEKQQRATTAS